MKKIISVIILVVLCFTLVSCGNSEVEIPKGMKSASEGSTLYYLFVPNNWSVKPGEPPTAFVSAEDMSNITVVAYMLEAENVSDETTSSNEAVSQNPKAKFIDQFWAEFILDANAGLVGFSVIGDPTDSQSLGGSYAKQYIYEHKTGDVEYRHRMVITYYGGMIVYLLYSSTTEYYDSHAVDVDSIIREFKFKR